MLIMRVVLPWYIFCIQVHLVETRESEKYFSFPKLHYALLQSENLNSTKIDSVTDFCQLLFLKLEIG